MASGSTVDRGRRSMAKHGNPSWGQPQLLHELPSITAFETMVATFKLSPEQYGNSAALKEWVLNNKNERFVPERLLEDWGFTVELEPTYSKAA
jgi:hypothetical protein